MATTHGRAPVYRGDLDDIIGVAHLVDLVEAHGRVADHVRPALALPESVGVLDGLRRLQAERQTLAMVINEYGGTEGIVTVEDLLEVLAVEHRAITRLRLTPSRDDKNPSAEQQATGE